MNDKSIELNIKTRNLSGIGMDALRYLQKISQEDPQDFIAFSSASKTAADSGNETATIVYKILSKMTQGNEVNESEILQLTWVFRAGREYVNNEPDVSILHKLIEVLSSGIEDESDLLKKGYKKTNPFKI